MLSFLGYHFHAKKKGKMMFKKFYNLTRRDHFDLYLVNHGFSRRFNRKTNNHNFFHFRLLSALRND